MNITRHNYEEYFILYLDNELAAGDRRAVEVFVQENPDLKQELAWLLETRLVPETSVVFEQKDQLLRDHSTRSLDTTNYQEWLLLYIDNELSAKEKAIADELIASNVSIRTEFELLQKTRLQPEPIVFRDKKVLYRTTEKVRVISLQWRRIAVAAVLLIACGTGVFVAFNGKDNPGQTLADKAPEKKASPQLTTDAQKQETNTATNTIVPNDASAINTEVVIANTETNTPGKSDISAERELIQHPSRNNSQKETLIANLTKEEKPTNNLPLPTHNANVIPETGRDNPIAKIDVQEKKDLTNSKENLIIAAVTPGNLPSLDYSKTADYRESVDPNEEEQAGKKSKLRGFFRKVTRTIEKRTNIKATDDEDRLLLAGFAVKL